MKENSKLIFISHAFADRKIVDKIIDKLLLEVFELNKSRDIFYTSKRETGISSRSKWKETIKTNLKSSEIFVAVITSNFKMSEMCIGEVGAAWVLNKKIYTLILPPIQYEDSNILLTDLQSDNLLSNSDVKSFILALALDIQTSSNIRVKPEIDITQTIVQFTKSIKSYLRRNPFNSKKVKLTTNIEAIENKLTENNDVDEDLFKSPRIPSRILNIISSLSKQKWPNDYSMQEYQISEQIKAVNGLRTLYNSILNRPEKLNILNIAVNKYPNDFEMQLYDAQEQIAAYDRLEKDKFDDMRISDYRIVTKTPSRKHHF